MGAGIRALLADGMPTLVWSSPYVRAEQTAAIALKTAGQSLPVTVDERLRDRELGVLDLLTTKGVQNRFPLEAERRRWLGKFYHRPPGGESWADVVLRIRSFLRDLDQVPDGTRAVLVCHDALVLTIRYVCERLTESDILAIGAATPVLNVSLTQLVRDPATALWRLERFNDVSHLESSDAPVTQHGGGAMSIPARDVTPALLRDWPLPATGDSKYSRGKVLVVGGAALRRERPARRPGRLASRRWSPLDRRGGVGGDSAGRGYPGGRGLRAASVEQRLRPRPRCKCDRRRAGLSRRCRSRTGTRRSQGHRAAAAGGHPPAGRRGLAGPRRVRPRRAAEDHRRVRTGAPAPGAHSEQAGGGAAARPRDRRPGERRRSIAAKYGAGRWCRARTSSRTPAANAGGSVPGTTGWQPPAVATCSPARWPAYWPGGAEGPQAVCYASHLHAAAGDRLAVSVGALGFLARELLPELPRVLVELGV